MRGTRPSFDRALLQPGDCCLYSPKWWSLTGWIISLKTWHTLTHCEAYIGDGESVASRDGLGVNLFPFREDGIAMVLRPATPPFDLDAAMRWFQTVQGQRYDWLGLVRFAWRERFIPGGTNNKQFCSEFLTRWYRRGRLDPFNGEDADAVPPFLFSCSPVLRKVWSLKGSIEAVSAEELP